MDPNEDLHLRVAVQQSLEDQDRMARMPAAEDLGFVEAQQETPPRLTIDDMIQKIQTWQTSDIPMVHDPNGDTWIFIDAASQQPEQDATDYDFYKKRCAKPIQLKKDALMRLNSSVINKAFEPTSQFRELRRRHLVNQLPGEIKYVIDLTPPNEGEDAVWLLTSLSCSEGVRLWFHAQEVWGVSRSMVSGIEEYTSKRVIKKKSASQNQPSSTPGSRLVPQTAETNQQTSSDAVQSRLISAEYSPIRHRAAIERVLAAAQGANPKLDSAPKVWTTFAVAKHLDIVDSPLTDYFVTWLRASPNSVFLEVLTETSHIMADHLQVYDLERDTFAMLVGEEALDSLHRSKHFGTGRSFSAFGRKKEDLPEHIQTRVEYASKKFTDRISFDFEELKEGRWIDSLPEVRKLMSHTQPEMKPYISRIRTILGRWVKGTILQVLCSSFESVPTKAPYSTPGQVLVPRNDPKAVYNNLSQGERILTRFFWIALKTLGLFEGASNMDIDQVWSTISLAPSDEEPTLKDIGCHKVSRFELRVAILAGKDQLTRLQRDKLQKKDFAGMIASSLESSASAGKEGADQCISLPFRPRSATEDLSQLPTEDQTLFDPGVINLSWPAPTGFADYAELGDDSENEHFSGPRDTVDTMPLLDEEAPTPRPGSPEDSAFAESYNSQWSTQMPERTGPIFPKAPVFFDSGLFFSEAEDYVRMVAGNKLYYADQWTRKEPYELVLLNTLVCLEDTEFQYLPLWAGGNDDETGGVFQEDVPMPDVSFATAGPSIQHGAAMHTMSECDTLSVTSGIGHRDLITPTSSASSSAYHFVDGTGSTNPSSIATIAGSLSTQLHHNQIYAAESVDDASDTDDSFSIIARSDGMNSDDEEEQARRQIEAMERIEAAEMEAAGADRQRQASLAVEDENYADLFGSEDDDDNDEQEEVEGYDSDDTMRGESNDSETDEGELI